MSDGLKARIVFAHSIPYNPSARAVVLFGTLGSVYGVLNLFPWFQSRLWFGAAVCFKGIAVLLFLRRSVWKRVLTIADDSFVVPIGFLRMRPTRLMFMSIRRVWLTNLAGTLILRIRTTERDIEIQDAYLPDGAMIWDLKRILESPAPQNISGKTEQASNQRKAKARRVSRESSGDTVKRWQFFFYAGLVSALSIGALQRAQGQEVVRSTYTYKTVGDLRIRADVYRKPDDAVRPAILWLHGGALISGNRRGLNAVQAEKYLDAGYTIISIDYRLAPQAKLQHIIEDLVDAYRWIRVEGPKLFRIDPNRIAVVGHSAGGYLTLMAGLHLNPRPTALVSFYGYGDIAGAWYSRPDPFYNRQPAVAKDEAYQAVGTRLISEDQGGSRGRFYLYTRQQGIWPLEVVGHDPDKEPRAFDPMCPVRNVSKDYPPTLLLHGDNDTDVPYEQSVLMAKELERQGVQHELITMPGRGHGFDGTMWDPAIAQTFDRVLAFLKKQFDR